MDDGYCINRKDTNTNLGLLIKQISSVTCCYWNLRTIVFCRTILKRNSFRLTALSLPLIRHYIEKRTTPVEAIFLPCEMGMLIPTLLTLSPMRITEMITISVWLTMKCHMHVIIVHFSKLY